MSDASFAWAIHYDDGKKHPEQPRGISSGIVVLGMGTAQCRVTLAQFKDPIDLTKCYTGFVWKGQFFKQPSTTEDKRNSNETD